MLPEPTPTTTPEPKPGAAPKPTGGEEDSGKVSLTQTELNRQFAERARQAKSAAQKDMLEALGVEKLEDAQALVSKVKAAEAANKTELEKMQAERDVLKAKFEKEAEKNQALALRFEFNSQVKDLEIQFASTKAEEDAFAHIIALKLEADKSGKFDGLKEAIQKVIEERSYLVGEAQTSAPNLNAGSRGKITLAKVQRELVEAKRRAYGQPL